MKLGTGAAVCVVISPEYQATAKSTCIINMLRTSAFLVLTVARYLRSGHH